MHASVLNFFYYTMKQKEKWNAFYTSQKRESFLHFSEEQIDDILRKFPDTQSVLDIGCGEGQLMVQLESRGMSTVGIDVSEVGIKTARESSKGQFIVGDFETFEFPTDTAFDLIFVKFVIAFIEKPDLFFQKVAQLLSSHGGLILLTPVMPNPDRLSPVEEVFTDLSILDECFSRYFSSVHEEVLYADGEKRLVLYTAIKK